MNWETIALIILIALIGFIFYCNRKEQFSCMRTLTGKVSIPEYKKLAILQGPNFINALKCAFKEGEGGNVNCSGNNNELDVCKCMCSSLALADKNKYGEEEVKELWKDCVRKCINYEPFYLR